MKDPSMGCLENHVLPYVLGPFDFTHVSYVQQAWKICCQQLYDDVYKATGPQDVRFRNLLVSDLKRLLLLYRKNTDR